VQKFVASGVVTEAAAGDWFTTAILFCLLRLAHCKISATIAIGMLKKNMAPNMYTKASVNGSFWPVANSPIAPTALNMIQSMPPPMVAMNPQAIGLKILSRD
jgi:hypothetical protein